MSLLKIILIVAAVIVVVFGVMMYVALSPSIRNASDKAALKYFLNKPLILKRSVFLYRCEGVESRFFEDVISDLENQACQVMRTLPTGTVMRIEAFKTYKSAVSGFTNLFALAEIEIEGKKVKVEYNWGSTDLNQLAKTTPTLPRAVWQDEDEPLVIFTQD